MELILVRHAETVENLEGICQGQTDGNLSELGWKQSRLLAQEIQEHRPTVFYCSPLRRALQTAEEITKRLPALPIHYDQRLAERYLGPLETKAFPVDYNGLFDYEGTETMAELLDRMSRFFDDIREHHPDDRVMVLSHGTALIALRSVLDGKEAGPFTSIPMQRNASISVFSWTVEQGLEVVFENDIKHLNEDV